MSIFLHFGLWFVIILYFTLKRRSILILELYCNNGLSLLKDLNILAINSYSLNEFSLSLLYYNCPEHSF